jgi:hypothetical protein
MPYRSHILICIAMHAARGCLATRKSYFWAAAPSKPPFAIFCQTSRLYWSSGYSPGRVCGTEEAY